MLSVTMQRSLLLHSLLLLAAVPQYETRNHMSTDSNPRFGSQRYTVSLKPSVGEKFLALVLQGLAITGLSLLFPTVVTVNSGRSLHLTNTGEYY